MKKIPKKVKDTINIVTNAYGKSPDLNTRIIKINNINVGILFFESSSQTSTISDFIIKSIDFTSQNVFENLFNQIKNYMFNCQVLTIKNLDEFYYYLSSGFTILTVDENEEAIVMETRAQLDRGVTESTSEPVLRGSKDSFTESHSKNLGLIRKRIKDPNLWFEEVKVGRRTETRISIGFINGIANKETVKQIKEKLQKIDIDGIIESGNLRDYLTNKPSTFPQFLSTERPDIVCNSMLNGKIAILVENTPFVLIIPTVFIDFLHTSEDQTQKWINITFTRILKVCAFFITLFTPAIYVAITTIDQNVIPDKLLISLAIQREGVPFPTAFEIILLGIIFEIIREGDVRSPSNMSAAMSIVGALVLGQAAVDAGIVSPITVIITAITSICSMIFTDIDFTNGIRAWRFIFIIAASFLGLTGVLAASLILLIKLASTENFGTSYLAPLAPFNLEDQKDSILRFPTTKILKRPSYTTKKNKTKQRRQK